MITHSPGHPNQEPLSPQISISHLQSSSEKPKEEADVLNPAEKRTICAAAEQKTEASGDTHSSRAGKQPCISLHSFIFQPFWQRRRFLRRFQNISMLSSWEECDTGTGGPGRSGWPQQSPALHPRVQLKPVVRARGRWQKRLRQAGIYQIPFSHFFFKALVEARKVCRRVGLSLQTCLTFAGERGKRHQHPYKSTEAQIDALIQPGHGFLITSHGLLAGKMFRR